MSATAGTVRVLDVGGTHVTAARADTGRWRVVAGSRCRTPLRGDAAATEIIATLATAARQLGDAGSPALGIAMPGPFDYATGIGRFRGVGKFDALNGVDLGSALRAALPAPPARVVFVNDASAFTLGEWIGGAARGASRVVGITLGTGVGSAFLDHGRVVSAGPDVPPGGYAHLLRVGRRPLEDLVSRRAITAAYASARAAGGRAGASPPRRPDLDVDAIAGLALSGDSTALSVIGDAIGTLGRALRPWLVRFRADILVVGGGLAGSWEVTGPALERGLFRSGTDPAPAWRGAVARARDAEESALVGAAWHAVQAGWG